MAVTRLPDGRWICYFRTDGKIKKEYFGRGATGEAAARQRDQELGLQKRRPAKKHTGPTVAEIASSYLDAKHFNDNSLKHVKIRLETTMLPVLGHKTAMQLTDNDMDMYVNKRLQTVKSSTVRRELTDIKAILTWAAKRRPAVIPFNPVRDYPMPKSDDEIIHPPTEDEIRQLYQAAGPHIKRFILLAYYAGLRPGYVELLTLTWKDVMWDSIGINVKSAAKGGPVRRFVPIHPEFIDILKAWHMEDGEKEGPIIHFRGQPIRTIGKAWKATLTRAGITRRIRPYDLRHRFVTSALESGADIKALAEIVGSSPETLRKHYQHVSERLHRETILKIPDLGIQNIPNKENIPAK